MLLHVISRTFQHLRSWGNRPKTCLHMMSSHDVIACHRMMSSVWANRDSRTSNSLWLHSSPWSHDHTPTGLFLFPCDAGLPMQPHHTLSARECDFPITRLAWGGWTQYQHYIHWGTNGIGWGREGAHRDGSVVIPWIQPQIKSLQSDHLSLSIAELRLDTHWSNVHVVENKVSAMPY